MQRVLQGVPGAVAQVPRDPRLGVPDLALSASELSAASAPPNRVPRAEDAEAAHPRMPAAASFSLDPALRRTEPKGLLLLGVTLGVRGFTTPEAPPLLGDFLAFSLPFFFLPSEAPGLASVDGFCDFFADPTLW